MNAQLVRAVRWAARITAGLLIALVVTSAIGEGGPPNVLAQPPAVQIEFAAMFLMIAGCLIGWRSELWGGMLLLIGFLLFFATEFVVNGKPPGGAIPLFAVPGVLYFLSFALTSVTAKATDSGAS